MDNLSLKQCFEILNLTSDATLEDIEKNYYKLVGETLKTDHKQDLINLKKAHSQLIEYYQYKNEQEEEKEKENYEKSLTKIINNSLKKLAIKVKVQSSIENLKITLNNIKLDKKEIIITIIYDALCLNLKDSQTSVIISSFNLNHHLIWQEEIKIYTGIYHEKAKNYNQNILLKKAEIITNTYSLPIAFLIAFAVNFIEPLAWFITMWIHEFGHGTIAWFSGYRAMVTFAGTVISPNRSLFVYFGILILLILTYYRGWKEGKKNTLIICIVLVTMQFILTWLTSDSTYQILLYFGGIGGEFYLSTLLIIAFYWELPTKFYWEFWRFFALIIGAITFWGSFTKWHRISLGKDQIPWGTFWGGRGDSGGDLNVLNEAGWSINQIINTYNTLGLICLIVIVSTYFYYLWKTNPIFSLTFNQLFCGRR